MCYIDCGGANECQPLCENDALCIIDCSDVTMHCNVECIGGSTCIVDCNGAGSCDITGCTGTTDTCGNVKVCNESCP